MKKNLQKEMIRWMLVLCGAVIMVTCEKGDDLQLTHQEDTLELQSNKFTKFMETRSFSLDRSQGLYTYMQGTGYMLSRSGNHNILVLPLGEVHLETGIGVVQDDTGGVNYAFHLNENEPLSDTFYNYVLKKDVEGNFINDYILEYRMSPSFAGQYNAGIVSLDQFEGAVQRLSTSSSRTMETLCPLNEVNNGNGNNSNGTGTASGDGNYGDDVPDDGNTGDPGDTAGDGNSQDSDPYGNGTGEGPGSSDTGTNTACTMTRMVRGCGCQSSGSSNCVDSTTWHALEECGQSEPQRVEAGAEYEDRLQCVPTQKGASGRMMGEDCKEDIIIVDDDIDEAYEDFEDRIYYNTLRDCVSQIVDDIKTLENGKISDIIRALNGDSTDHLNYNWSIVETSNQVFFNEDQLGMTNPTIQNGLSISRLNRVELSESTDMLYAQVIMHESYHAYLVNYIKVNNPPLFNPPDFQDYEYKDMIREVNIGIKNFNEAQHSQFIRDDMVGAMAAALLEYSQLKNYNVSLEFCKNLAWAGLQGTSTYNSLSNRNEIEEILEAEKISQNNGDQQPEGLKACQ